MTSTKSLSKLNKVILARNHLNIKQLFSSLSSFKHADLSLDLKKNLQKPDLPEDSSKLVFGHTFTDHMLSIKYKEKSGWNSPTISPFKNLEIHPAAKVLHYAVEIFEGMKAYRGVDQKIRLFRPDMNMARFYRSAQRSSFPDFDINELLECIKQLVSVEKLWIPNCQAASLYIRPTLIATEPTLGVSPATEALLYCITSPTGPYFPTGFKPVSLLADPKFVRAWPGGVGNFKVGSNYGPTINVAVQANKVGCQQVLWLLGEEEYVTEAGTMNIFFVIRNKNNEIELITPPLKDGTILPGVTRQSMLDLAKGWGKYKVTERQITMKEVLELIRRGQMLEAFGSGTACVCAPIESILYKDTKYEIPTMSEGAPIMSEMSQALNDIHYGRVEHEWAPVIA